MRLILHFLPAACFLMYWWFFQFWSLMESEFRPGQHRQDTFSSSAHLHQIISLPSHSLHDGLNISWIGDDWIFPGGIRNYRIHELQVIFSKIHILWVGDSTVRRTFATLDAILQVQNTTRISMEEVDSAQVIDQNKGAPHEKVCERWTEFEWIDKSSICRTFANNFRFDYIAAPCLKDIFSVVEHVSLVEEYDLVIVSGGTWDMSPHKRHACSGGPFPQEMHLQWHRLVNTFQELKSPHVIWRTLAMNQHELEKEAWLEFNKLTKNDIVSLNSPKNMSYIDFATAIEPRTVLYERIAGNNIYHLGLKGRLLFVQMLANHVLLKLNERRR